MGVFKAILKRNIALLLSSQLISTMGSIMQTTALSLFVLSKTGSAITFASVLAVSILPRLFGPFTGVLTDRMNRKRMLVVLDVLAGFVTFCFAIWHQFFGGLAIPCVYLLVLMLSALQTFYDPTVSAIIPEIVDRNSLEETNSASSFVSNIAYIMAAAVAGLMYMSCGLAVVMAVNAISFIIAAAFEAFIRYKASPELHIAAQEPVFKSFKEGLSTVFRSKELFIIVIISIIANLAIYPICNVGIPLIMKKALHVTDGMFGVSQAMLFVGPVIGSVLAMFVLKRVNYKRMLTWVLALDSVLIGTISALTAFGTVSMDKLVLFFLINFTALLIIAAFVLGGIAISTTLQKLVPVQLLGRVSAVDASLSLMAIPLGQILFSLISDYVSSSFAFALFAVFTLIAGLTAYFLYKPILRNSTAAEGQGPSAG